MILLDDVRLCAALCGLQCSNLRPDCRSTLEWGQPYPKFSFGEVYRRIDIRKLCFTAPLMHRCKTKFPTVYPLIYLPNENFEYSYLLNVQHLYETKLSIYHLQTVSHFYCQPKTS